LAFFFPVLQRRERTYADSYAIATQNPNKLGNMFRFIRVHKGFRSMLKRPTRTARFENDGIAA
jgi:hypothetical protein